jgi:phage major head subunit gpT-like protein
MSTTDQLDPLVVRTELDAIFVQEYENADLESGYVTAESPDLFRQMTMDNAAYSEQTMEGGGGFWQIKGETQNVPTADILFKNKQTFYAKTWANSLPISKEFFDDNLHNAYTEMIQKFARNARETRDLFAFGLYRAAFTGTDPQTGNNYLTADGLSWINPAHTTGFGTVSNELSGNPVLTPASLFDAIKGLQTLKSEDGVAMNQKAVTLVVAPANIRNAMQVTESEYVSNLATNAIEIFSSKYGIRVRSSAYLDTTFGGFGTNDAGWIILSRGHSATRFVREGVSTDLVDWRISPSDTYIYKGRYREEYGVVNYAGAYGSDGSGI